MTKKTETPEMATPETFDIVVPQLDTPYAELTPLVIDAMEAGATARGHETDATKIIVTIADKARAEKFQAAIDAVLKNQE